MKTLLIDNESKHNDELKEILTSNGLDLEIASHNQIPDDLTSIELITLSGSSHSVHGNRQRFQTEFDLIQKFEKPLIGICFGFELIAYAFGIKLQKLDKKREGIETVKVTQKDNIFGDLEEFEVCEGHSYSIAKLEEPLVELARSKTGVEIFKHQSLPIYGFQFHPEVAVDGQQGSEIFSNLISLLKNS
ncbi:MAG: GMP synthase [glutamine-hydrolyzing] subunit A [candidate division CPR1 bacterium GW2011_GWC1_49_13]|uniref:GMP synthase [glutamine-hydrolyzing] subunit A n=1 Tax=candidate division CPR1 bacterium GW2011_GWC1_49_13 TaxID=1618342 RepID=A0A0G1VG66_9BACT|nr:MAG: GMP synthase [glutamine-hydrolyzing] subunit A [candidate division CPR1 bacterium GW2011_GWC1_49_13]